MLLLLAAAVAPTDAGLGAATVLNPVVPGPRATSAQRRERAQRRPGHAVRAVRDRRPGRGGGARARAERLGSPRRPGRGHGRRRRRRRRCGPAPRLVADPRHRLRGTPGSSLCRGIVRRADIRADSTMATAGTVGENGTGLYRLPYVAIDWQVPAFALGATLAAGLLCGIAPALFGSRGDPNDVLKEGGRSSSDGRGIGRLRGAFVVAEIALAVVVLAAAGVFVRSFLTVTAIDPGFEASRAVTLNYMLPRGQYSTPETRLAFGQRLQERLHAQPGVQAVGFGSLPIVHDPPSLPYSSKGNRFPTTRVRSARVFPRHRTTSLRSASRCSAAARLHRGMRRPAPTTRGRDRQRDARAASLRRRRCRRPASRVSQTAAASGDGDRGRRGRR